jgi:menaquinone-9 beta-reductase
MRRLETIIVGGGPAGAATACGLADLGREALLIERAGGPHHKVCGEFLSIETQSLLRRLNVEPAALGAAAIDRIAVYAPTRAVTTALPFRARSLSRYRLDDALLRCAESHGAQVKRNVSVRSVTPAGNGWTVSCDDDATLHSRNLVLATGKWGMRGLTDARDNSMVGLKMHLRLAPHVRDALANRVELALLDRGYAGLELVEDGIANLCFLLPRAVVARLGPHWPAMQGHLMAANTNLAERLTGAEPLLDRAVAVVCPAGGHLHDGHEESEFAVYRVGDRLAHIPPFTGDGLAIALGSAALAVEYIRRERAPAAYLAAARRLTGKPIRLASAVSALAASGAGSSLLLGAAARAPRLIQAIVQRTRLPPRLT